MNQLEKFRDVRTFFFDVDGVFTDSNLLITEKGELLRTMNVRDGYAVKRALNAGYQIVIITGGSSEGVKLRLQSLGIEDVFSGVSKKIEVFQRYLDRSGMDPQGILYMGDDLADREVMQKVGFPACPADAVPEIRSISDYISPYPGGHGCVRDVIEKTLKLADKWL